MMACPSNGYARDDTALLNDLLDGIEKKYTHHEFSADFLQLSRLQTIDITERAEGKAYFSYPGKMRWEYQKPDVHQIITNGKTLWIYNQEERQVIQGKADKLFKAGAGGAFLSDIAMIRKNFNIHIKEATPEFAQLDMVSKKNDPDISSIVIKVNRKSYEIQEVVTYNIYDDTTRFNFSNIKFKDLDNALFEFVIPENTDIIDMNE